MAGMTLEWQVFLRGIEKRIRDTELLIQKIESVGLSEMDAPTLSWAIGQLNAFREVRDYIKGEME